MARNKIIPYRKDLRKKARWLRNNSTLGEIILWKEIKNRRLKGYQFHRQVPMLDFIVDFYCHELHLAIEVDGSSHYSDQAQAYDQSRTERLARFGVEFLRFDDKDVKKHINDVLNTIFDWIDTYDAETKRLHQPLKKM